MKKISVANDFSRFPSGRKKSRGTTSGEHFREIFIEPAIFKGEPIIIDLDGAIGYGSSFLEEAFGGAIRSTGISPERFNKLVHIQSRNKILLKEIERYINEASKVQARNKKYNINIR